MVAANYRLGVFGFATTLQQANEEDDAGEDGEPRAVANNGYRDQQEALRWVRRHIGAFGGDPTRITIFGQSAGGRGAAFHVLSPSSSGLFDGAISESGDITDGSDPVEVGLRNTAAVARKLGCAGAGVGDLASLRKVSAKRLAASSGAADYFKVFEAFKPVVDGDLLPKPVLELVQDGDFNQVPFVMGVTLREGAAFIYAPTMPQSVPATAGDVACSLRAAVGAENARRILELYPPDDAPGIDNRRILAGILGDLSFACPNRRIAVELGDCSRRVHSAPWFYVFHRHGGAHCTYVDAIPGYIWAQSSPGAGHGVDVPYAFDNLEWVASNPEISDVPANGSCRVPAEEGRGRRAGQTRSDTERGGADDEPA